MKYIRYLRYVLRHKWFVMRACFRFRLYWTGIIHDLSKFYPDEFIPYARHFYGGNAGIKTGRDSTGYYKPTDTGDPAFDYAWMLHQKRNKHHWQWWCLPDEYGVLKVLEMPLKYRKEMVADWLGAGRAQGTPGILNWYAKNGSRMALGVETRQWVEKEIGAYRVL